MQNAPSFVAQQTAQLLSEALRLHQAGALGQAQSLYEKILALDANHADALHLAGVAQYQGGHYDEAEQHIRRAIERNGTVASYHANLGLVLEAKRQPEAARAEYLRAIQLQSGYAEAYLNLGNLLLAEGRTDEAIEVLKKLLALHPDYSAGHNSLGCAYREQGQWTLAANHFHQALRSNPANASAHCNLGVVLRQLGALEDALVCFHNVLRLQPQSVEALNQIGAMLRENGEPLPAVDYHERAVKAASHKAESLVLLAKALGSAGKKDEAIARCREALEEQANFVAAHGEWANLLREQGKIDEAKDVLARALAINSEYAEGYNTLGVIAEGEGQLGEAQRLLEKAIVLKPGFPEAYNNLGITYWSQGRFTEARLAYEQSLAERPSYMEARWNLALAQLIDGDYAEGWRNYEARWQRASAPRRFPQPLWQGESLAGKRILLHSEQGLGDSLQFLRFVPQVIAAGGKVILDVQRRVVPLAQELAGVEAVVAEGQPQPDFDVHCPLMSLPLALGVTLENLPAAVPYLTTPAEARVRAQRVAWPAEGLRVGLAWNGSAKNALNPTRAIPFAEFAPLFALAGVHFYSLQMGRGVEQLAQIKNEVVDLAAYQSDLADAAALVEQLDLVISVDTMVAHLAGALGRPTWTLLPFAPDWRWLREDENCPWYPTMRLFRQPKLGDWTAVVAAVRTELEKRGPGARDQGLRD